MKKIFPIFFLCVFAQLLACNLKIVSSYSNPLPTLDYLEKVKVIKVEDELPKDLIRIGEIEIKDAGFTTNCTYQTVIEHAKLEARKVGGNVLKLTEHKVPDIVSTCHRIKADIYQHPSTAAQGDNDNQEGY